MSRTLLMLRQTFTIHRFPSEAEISEAVLRQRFTCITRTDDELSILAPSDLPLPSPESSPGWSGFRVAGKLDFSEIGVLSALAQILAEAGVSIFAVSTYDTDYLFLKTERLADARQALEVAGYQVQA